MVVPGDLVEPDGCLTLAHKKKAVVNKPLPFFILAESEGFEPPEG